MAFDLLAEVKRLEKQLKEVLAGMAVASKGKPMPPQASRLCGMSQALAEMRTSIENAAEPASPSPKTGNDEGNWGTAFKAPPAPPSDVDSGPEDVAEAWLYDDGPSSRPPRPASRARGADAAEFEPVSDDKTIEPPIFRPKADSEEGWEDLDELDGGP